MAVKPGTLYWVEMRLSGNPIPYNLWSSSIKGGKMSSLEAARERKRTILRADPDATVTIYQTDTKWAEVPDEPTPAHGEDGGFA